MSCRLVMSSSRINMSTWQQICDFLKIKNANRLLVYRLQYPSSSCYYQECFHYFPSIMSLGITWNIWLVWFCVKYSNFRLLEPVLFFVSTSVGPHAILSLLRYFHNSNALILFIISLLSIHVSINIEYFLT